MKKHMFVIFPIIHFLLTFYTDKLIFNTQNLNVFWYTFCKIIAFILIMLFWNIIRKLLKKDHQTIKRTEYFLIYFIPLILLLIFIWPGYWAGSDVTNLLSVNTSANMLYFLNYLTSVFNIVGYILFFSPTGPIILQIVLASSILAYIVDNLYSFYKTKYVYFTYLPFLLPITLCYMTYCNRQTIYGLIYFLFIAILIIDKLKKVTLNKNKLLLLMLLIGILTTFRSEGIYLSIIGPILILATYNNKFTLKKAILIFIATWMISIAIYIPQGIYNKNLTYIEKETRNLPSIVNPLSYMLTQNLKGPNIENEIAIIDNVLDVDILKKYPSLFDSAAIWEDGGALRDNVTKDDYNAMKKAYYDIVKNNIFLYLNCKKVTFYNSTGLGKNFLSSYNKFENIENINGYKLATPLNKDLRRNILIILEGRNSENNEIYGLYKLFNNLIFSIITLILIFLFSVFKRKFFDFMITGTLIGHILIVFIMAPANYFMYYYSIYLTGFLILIVYLLNIKSKIGGEMIMKNKKVLFIASTGGHLSELLQLKEMFNNYNYYLITEKTDSTKDLIKKHPNKVSYLTFGTKDHKLSYLFKFSGNCLKSLFLYFKIRPRYIVTTGTHTAVPMCYIGHFFGSKVIFIETFANSKTKTLSGKMVYPIADYFIVQWESMLEKYPNAKYGGWIY